MLSFSDRDLPHSLLARRLGAHSINLDRRKRQASEDVEYAQYCRVKLWISSVTGWNSIVYLIRGNSQVDHPVTDYDFGLQRLKRGLRLKKPLVCRTGVLAGYRAIHECGARSASRIALSCKSTCSTGQEATFWSAKTWKNRSTGSCFVWIELSTAREQLCLRIWSKNRSGWILRTSWKLFKSNTFSIFVYHTVKIQDFIYYQRSLFLDSSITCLFIIAIGSTRCLSCQLTHANKTRNIN